MESAVFIKKQEGKVMIIITLGIDLAKGVIVVQGVIEIGKAELVKPRVTRDRYSR
jgi:transposase